MLIAFGAIPRIVLGPVLLMIEGATFFLFGERLIRELMQRAQRTQFGSVAKAFGQAGTNPSNLALLTIAPAVP